METNEKPEVVGYHVALCRLDSDEWREFWQVNVPKESMMRVAVYHSHEIHKLFPDIKERYMVFREGEEVRTYVHTLFADGTSSVKYYPWKISRDDMLTDEEYIMEQVFGKTLEEYDGYDFVRELNEEQRLQ